MTAFHDAVLATDPVVFVPFDAPGDTSTVANNLGSVGGAFVQTIGGTRQASAGTVVAFDYELALDGIDDYWSANSTLFTALMTAMSVSTVGTTWAVWWRTSITADKIRYLLSVDPYGMGIFRTATGSITVEFTDQSSVLQQMTRASQILSEQGGGWQLSGQSTDPAENTGLFIYRNGFRQQSGGSVIVSGGSTSKMRTSGSTSFTIGTDLGTASREWSGSVGPVMAWDRALSADEFMTIYLAGLGAAETVDLTLQRQGTSRMQPRILLRAEA
jgi:hypothetical protein